MMAWLKREKRAVRARRMIPRSGTAASSRLSATKPEDHRLIKDRMIDEEAASDRARVIYSSAFRRLQHKTQVFTLSKDAAVRSRLAHSMEVASVGRWIAQRVVDRVLATFPLKIPHASPLFP